ncbi:hypothetical protein BD414DRAFT_496129, partial [Trametes punicea]
MALIFSQKSMATMHDNDEDVRCCWHGPTVGILARALAPSRCEQVLRSPPPSLVTQYLETARESIISLLSYSAHRPTSPSVQHPSSCKSPFLRSPSHPYQVPPLQLPNQPYVRSLIGQPCLRTPTSSSCLLRVIGLTSVSTPLFSLYSSGDVRAKVAAALHNGAAGLWVALSTRPTVVL